VFGLTAGSVDGVLARPSPSWRHWPAWMAGEPLGQKWPGNRRVRNWALLLRATERHWAPTAVGLTLNVENVHSVHLADW